MRIAWIGPRALLLEVDDPVAWYAELSGRRAAGELLVGEIVPGATTVLLDHVYQPEALAERLAGWAVSVQPAPAEGERVDIPVVYGGPDLDDVAMFWGAPAEAVVERLSTTEFRVAFCGFVPGFGYLTGLPPELSVPRLTEPRPRVPAGSVGLAGPYAGIYPTASPGGWRLVGRTDVRLFDVDRDPPALLAPGVRVRLVPA